MGLEKYLKDIRLLDAVNESNTSMVKKAIQDGANVNFHYDNTNGDTPLHVAVRNGDADIVKILLESGSENIRDYDGETAYSLATRLGKFDVLKQFFEKFGENVEEVNTNDYKFQNPVYRRKYDKDDKNHSYIFRLLSLLLLRLKQNCNFKCWYLGSNIENLDEFGDIVLHHRYYRKETTWFVKAVGKIQQTASETGNENSENCLDNFNIHTLFRSFLQTLQQINDPQFRKFLPPIHDETDYKFIVHTTDDIDFGELAMIFIEPFDIEPDHPLQTIKQGKAFKFQKDEELVNSLVQNCSMDCPNLKESAIQFLNSLNIFYSQAPLDKLDVLYQECKKMELSSDDFHDFMEEMRIYYSIRGEVEYLTKHIDMEIIKKRYQDHASRIKHKELMLTNQMLRHSTIQFNEESVQQFPGLIKLLKKSLFEAHEKLSCIDEELRSIQSSSFHTNKLQMEDTKKSNFLVLSIDNIGNGGNTMSFTKPFGDELDYVLRTVKQKKELKSGKDKDLLQNKIQNCSIQRFYSKDLMKDLKRALNMLSDVSLQKREKMEISHKGFSHSAKNMHNDYNMTSKVEYFTPKLPSFTNRLSFSWPYSVK